MSLSRSAEANRKWQEKTRARALEREKEVRERQKQRVARGLPAGRQRANAKVRVPASIRARVLSRSLGVCVVCLEREGVDPERITLEALHRLAARGVVRMACQLHHVLDEQNWKHLAKLAENLVGVCVECHQSHHFAPNGRIPRAALPACVFELAEAEGLTWYIESTYPVAA